MQDQNRRKIITWVPPLVLSVTLPAHAQTSEEPKDPPKDEPPKDEPPKDDPPKDDPPKDECIETLYRIKSASASSWESDPGVGAKDCISTDAEKADGSLFATISGDKRQQVVTVDPDCVILEAAFKAGQNCHSGTVSGNTATFDAVDKDISHVELIISCCVEGL